MFRKKKSPAPVLTAEKTAPVLRLLPGVLDEGTLEKSSGLSLAFLGDAVWELLIRSYHMASGDPGVQNLHKKTVSLANAAFQSAAAKAILPLLTEEETAVFKRGRNAHPGHVPKNKSGADYHTATGLEALFGWLYAKGEEERVYALFAAAVNEETR